MKDTRKTIKVTHLSKRNIATTPDPRLNFGEQFSIQYSKSFSNNSSIYHGSNISGIFDHMKGGKRSEASLNTTEIQRRGYNAHNHPLIHQSLSNQNKEELQMVELMKLPVAHPSDNNDNDSTSTAGQSLNTRHQETDSHQSLITYDFIDQNLHYKNGGSKNVSRTHDAP